jgi:hypothetical protein
MTKSRPQKSLSEMSDAEFGELLRTEYGLEWPGKPVRRKIEPYTATDELIARFKKGTKVRTTDLLRALAAAKLSSEFLELDHIRLPYEIIDIAAAKLAGGPKWNREQSKLRKERARTSPNHEEWQTLANTIWAKNPGLTKHAVARIVARQVGGNADWIRRAIKRK